MTTTTKIKQQEARSKAGLHTSYASLVQPRINDPILFNQDVPIPIEASFGGLKLYKRPPGRQMDGNVLV